MSKKQKAIEYLEALKITDAYEAKAREEFLKPHGDKAPQELERSQIRIMAERIVKEE